MITNSGQGSGSNFYVDNMQIIPYLATLGLLREYSELLVFLYEDDLKDKSQISI